MDAHELTSDGRLLAGLGIAFTGVTVLAAGDLVLDLAAGTTVRHALMEGGLFLVALAGAIIAARRFFTLRRSAREARLEAAELASRLEANVAEAARWRAEARSALDGLADALDRQFERWALTAAEKEVALLLLKGLSHKEIAAARSITEATARQQARAVYRKAGITGRHDLAAFFLEDLLQPRGERAR